MKVHRCIKRCRIIKIAAVSYCTHDMEVVRYSRTRGLIYERIKIIMTKFKVTKNH